MKMTWDLGFSTKTEQELDDIAVNQLGIVGRLDANSIYKPQVSIPKIGGWSAQWLRVNGPDGGFSLALKSLNGRTRALSREGKLRHYVKAGLTQQQAEILHRFDAQYKIELASTLAQILSSPEDTQAFIHHPQGGVDYGAQQIEVPDQHNQIYNKFGLCASREFELARMVVKLTQRKILVRQANAA